MPNAVLLKPHVLRVHIIILSMMTWPTPYELMIPPPEYSLESFGCYTEIDLFAAHVSFKPYTPPVSNSLDAFGSYSEIDFSLCPW